jgi:large subunit ribosomal protein L2
MAGQMYDDVTKTRPERSLLVSKSKKGGRNVYGRVTVRHHGGNRQKVRIVDYKREKIGVPATVAAIEYDPKRSARLALLTYADGEKDILLHRSA